jgi:hypothetical protein
MGRGRLRHDSGEGEGLVCLHTAAAMLAQKFGGGKVLALTSMLQCSVREGMRTAREQHGGGCDFFMYWCVFCGKQLLWLQ